MSQRKWSPLPSQFCTHVLFTMKPWWWKAQWGNSIYCPNIVKMIFEYKNFKNWKYLKWTIVASFCIEKVRVIFYLICVSHWWQPTSEWFIELPVHKCIKRYGCSASRSQAQVCIKPTGAYIVALQGYHQSQIVCFCQDILNICVLPYIVSHRSWIVGCLLVTDHHFFVHMSISCNQDLLRMEIFPWEVWNVFLSLSSVSHVSGKESNKFTFSTCNVNTTVLRL